MTPIFHLYVVELDPAVRKSRRFRDENPAGGERCLYVGSTAKTPAERYAQHKAGVLSNRGWVTKFGKRLCQELAGGSQYATRESAEQAERDLAEALRKEGYSVWSR